MSDKMDKDKYLWKFMPFGNLKGAKHIRTEVLHCRHILSAEYVAERSEVIGYQRRVHREEVGRVVTSALYDGWLPYDVEWWEGKANDPWILREYQEPDNDDYCFWTRIRVASMTYPVLKRAPDGVFVDEPTIIAYTPKGLVDVR